MAHVKIEIDASPEEIESILAQPQPSDKVSLNRESLNIVREDLLNFVHRVACGTIVNEGEIEILPAFTELLLRQFRS